MQFGIGSLLRFNPGLFLSHQVEAMQISEDFSAGYQLLSVELVILRWLNSRFLTDALRYALQDALLKMDESFTSWFKMTVEMRSCRHMTEVKRSYQVLTTQICEVQAYMSQTVVIFVINFLLLFFKNTVIEPFVTQLTVKHIFFKCAIATLRFFSCAKASEYFFVYSKICM